MVWIHGGAWQFGSAEMQNGAALAKCGDVIVVALSYRLGVFGFLFGNWGLWDQIEGLKWVQVRNPLFFYPLTGEIPRFQKLIA